MAGLGPVASRQGAISGAQQFQAIAYLRWRLFANSFRRKGGKGEVFAKIAIYPVFALFVLLPALGAGFGAWEAIHGGSPEYIPLIFLGLFVLQILVSINISPPGLSFDPESLIRFPLSFERYLVVRLFLGLLSAANVIGTVALLSAALGITIARPGLGAMAFGSAVLLALANIFFVRMIFAWIDRWLSTRRARELFTGLVILFSVGMQYVNVTLNPGLNRHNGEASRRKLEAVLHVYHSSQVVLARLHPELAGFAILNAARGAWAYSALDLAGVGLFAGLFLAIFAWRMQKEYRGENLSDSGAGRSPEPVEQPRPLGAGLATPGAAVSAANLPVRQTESGMLGTLLVKEFTYVRRNSSQLYAMLLPVAMVFLFAGRMGAQGARMWAFPAAIVYSTLAVAALSFNSFGLDGAGVQFYFLAPVRFRTILFAKNLFGFGITIVQALVVYAVISYVAGPPAPLLTITTMLWLVFEVLINVTFGNLRSITAPKKMDPSKLSRKQASQLSVLYSVACVLVTGAAGAGLILLGLYLGRPWVPGVILLGLAGGAAAMYVTGLGGVDALAGRYRETMIEELAKAS